METARQLLPKTGKIFLPMACSVRHRDFSIFAAPEEERSISYTNVKEVKVEEFKMNENSFRLGSEKRLCIIEKQLDESSGKIDKAQIETSELILRQQDGLEALSKTIEVKGFTAMISGIVTTCALALAILASSIFLWKTIHYYHN